MEERRLAEVADRDHAARYGNLGSSRQPGLVEAAEACVDLACAVVRTEVVRERIHATRAQRRELPPPDHDLLVVLRHASCSNETGSWASTGKPVEGQGSRHVNRAAGARGRAPRVRRW